MTEVSTITGRLIRKARKARGWTQGDLARALGNQASHVSDYEGGRRTITEYTITAFANTLHLSLSILRVALALDRMTGYANLGQDEQDALMRSLSAAHEWPLREDEIARLLSLDEERL